MWAFDLVQSTAMLKLSLYLFGSLVLYLFVFWFHICFVFSGGLCFGVKRRGGAGQFGFLAPAARVNICRGSPDKNNWVNPSLCRTALEKWPTLFFCQKLARASVSKADFSTSISGVSGC